jgi:hypothetical protein
MRRTLIFSLFLLTFAGVSLGVAGVAQAEVVQYMSRHPLPKRVGHGFCDIDVPHFHDYPPSDPRLYREVNGQYYFTGDPTPFGYEGPRYSFYGPHPIVDAGVQFGGPAYCYIRGPHYHWYAPPPQAQFEMKGGAYWYVGAYDPVFYSDQPRFVVVNDVYAPMVYDRPIVDVRIAPPAFRGEIVVGGGPGWRGGPGWHEGPGWREGPGWHEGPGPRPGFERREEVAHERREEFHHEQEHRAWEREHEHGPGPGWHGGPPPGHGPGFHPGPERGAGFHGPAGGPPHGAPAANGGGWHGPSGGPHQAPHGNGFHR